MSVNILVQFPTYGRDEKFLNVLIKYVSKASTDNLLHFNINCDAADLTMTSEYARRRIEYIFSTRKNVTYDLHYDANTEKISAINSHIPDNGWDIVVCASDDMVPCANFWDKHISDAMEEHFPGNDGCVYFDDGSHSAKDLITLSIMGSQLYHQFGYIYHPDYKSLYCDNEFTEVMKHHGKCKYVDKKIITHEHWSIEGSDNHNQVDIAVQKTLHYSGRDKMVYEKRKQLGFPRNKITHD